MKRPSSIQLSSLVLAGALLLATSAHAKIVCWTNNEGIRECGNAVPPEYAQKEVRTFNQRGMVMEVQERAKTAEEVKAEKAREAEEKRIAEEQEKSRNEQLRYDRVLLSTYLTEEDIIRSRERKSNLYEASIEVTRSTIEKLQAKLDEDNKRVAQLEKKGKKPPERVLQDITTLQQQIEEKQRFIDKKELEKQELHKQYDADLKRFRELKANSQTRQ